MAGEKLAPILKLGQEQIKALGITISVVYCGDDINPNYLVGQQQGQKNRFHGCLDC